MRGLGTAVVLLVLAAGVQAQSDTGRIEGALTDARGPLAGVEVRVKSVETGTVVRATTTATGAYAVTVPPGTYDVFATPTGYAAFAHRQVRVAAGTTAHAGGTLADNPNAGTPGEINFLYQRDTRPVPSGPTPRTADGRPDLSGVWFPGADTEPEVTPFQPWAEALTRARASRPGDDPRAQCLPSGVMRTNALDLAKFVHTPTLLLVLSEGSSPGVRQIFLDGRAHPADPHPTWMGHSVGTWEGDTLVVDSVGFNDRGWLDAGGRPQTERMHIVERFRRTDLGHMELEITIDDPGAYTRPWKVRRRLQLAPGEDVQEYVCNENNRIEHYVQSP